ncbi:MAG: glucose-6-phosphate isomerase [Gammaproteobacteria bacterium]|nr:glucose-6-phosphate isomerase [Gammaproteobacteria bacterium]
MNSQTLWQRYQDWLYFHEGLGAYVDVSRMGFDETLLETLAPKFADAFKLMADLEAGAIANPDENRRVGHYWLRDPDRAPDSATREEIVSTLADIESFVVAIDAGEIRPPRADRFTDILWVGIGGSALGPQFVSEALVSCDAPRAIHFIDNTDPAGFDRILGRLGERLGSTLVIITSKSGGTPETHNALVEVKQVFAAKGLDFAGHAVGITLRGSAMDKLEDAEGWLREFPMFDWVGGRTSEMSAVGLLAAALQGIDIRGMLAGAAEMDAATRVPEVRRNPAALLALSWYHAGQGKGEKDMVILPYKDSLMLFSRYLQQLVMESLGKEKDLDGRVVHQGLAVYGNKGSTDQHAYVQQLREGIPNFFATFIEVLEDRSGPSVEVKPGATSGDFLTGFLLGTRQALYENCRESITLTIPRVDARRVGALIALYERAVGLYAFLVNINAYHQPGVEAGKKAAAAILDLQGRICSALATAGGPISLAALAESIGATEQVETVYQIVRHLAANPRGFSITGDPSRPGTLTIAGPA